MKLIQCALIAVTAIGLSGCKGKSSVPAEEVANHAEAIAEMACKGSSPTGELTAQRIITANSTRTEKGLYEGPVWIKGALYFSDFIFTDNFSSRIQRLNADETLTTVIDDSGSNGMAVDAQGNIIAGTHKYKSLSRYNIATGERTSVADQYAGNVFNSPNDLTIAKDGTIYFTDPDFQRDAAPGGQPTTNIYRVGIDGKITVVDDSIKNPNGISLSLSGDVLYANGGEEQGILREYPIVNGIPQQGKTLITGLVVPDGMALDCHGNIYITEHTAKRVRVFTPKGEQLATINVDANVTNAAFGGAQGKTLFLTGAGALWKIELDVTGTPY